MNRARELVESATHIAGALRVPMCYVMDKPRAHVFYAVGSPTYLEQEARTDASIQAYYNECRAKGSPCHVGIDMENAAVAKRSEAVMVEVVCAGIEWSWREADKYDLWGDIRGNLHGASLAMIGAGFDEAQEDFEFLRDLAGERNNMKRSEK